MKVTVTCRSRDLDSAAREYAEDRVQKVLRVFDRLDAAHVVVDEEKGDSLVEATISAPRGARFVASSRSKDLRSAIDAMCQKLESQVRNWKDRLVDHRSSGPGSGPEP